MHSWSIVLSFSLHLLVLPQKKVNSLRSSVVYNPPVHLGPSLCSLTSWGQYLGGQPLSLTLILFSFLLPVITQDFQLPQCGMPCDCNLILLLPPCRKIPWINIYAQVQHDKEQEMIGSVSQSENAPKITLSDFTEPEELLDKELDTRVIGMCAGIPKLLIPLSSGHWVSQPMWPVFQVVLIWRVGKTNSCLRDIKPDIIRF